MRKHEIAGYTLSQLMNALDYSDHGDTPKGRTSVKSFQEMHEILGLPPIEG